MDFTTEEVFEFLSLYEAEPILWDPRRASHRSRNEVKQSWERIQTSFSVECSVDLLKKKKDSLMATFRPLISKVKKSMKQGSLDVYKPSWFAYEKMARFLLPIYLAGEMTTDAEEIQNTEDENDEQEQRDNYKRPSKSGLHKFHKKRKITDNIIRELQAISEPPMRKPIGVTRLERDSCSVYAELLAMRLREFDEFSRATESLD
ncbi:Myb/SANT-like transcription factor [Oryctes borbonicus]|uniref:Myb/SANT-like transcription factor n=1 Tax=Oryctes borbonicus TaxID=1629725 RepID=A0A0T6B4A8_9SCAR|nr:Myb/SANT-like transcription factor [Oryctes borbonicus]